MRPAQSKSQRRSFGSLAAPDSDWPAWRAWLRRLSARNPPCLAHRFDMGGGVFIVVIIVMGVEQ